MKNWDKKFILQCILIWCITLLAYNHCDGWGWLIFALILISG